MPFGIPDVPFNIVMSLLGNYENEQKYQEAFQANRELEEEIRDTLANWRQETDQSLNNQRRSQGHRARQDAMLEAGSIDRIGRDAGVRFDKFSRKMLRKFGVGAEELRDLMEKGRGETLGQFDATSEQSSAARRALSAGLIPQYKELRERGLGYLENVGEQERVDTERSYDELEAAQLDDIESRGLTGTNVRTGTQRGARRDKQEAVNRLAERLAREKLNTDVELTELALGAEERLTGNEITAREALGLARTDLMRSFGDDRNMLGKELFSGGLELENQLSRDRMGISERYDLAGLDRRSAGRAESRGLDKYFSASELAQENLLGDQDVRFLQSITHDYPERRSFSDYFIPMNAASEERKAQVEAAAQARRDSLFGNITGAVSAGASAATSLGPQGLGLFGPKE